MTTVKATALPPIPDKPEEIRSNREKIHMDTSSSGNLIVFVLQNLYKFCHSFNAGL